MKGSIPVKIGRVVANFALHPQYLPRAIRDNLINGATPLDLGLPWFSYAAIDFLAKQLRPEMNVAEYGSGGSTVFFAKRTQSVFSIEDNEKWFALVSQRIEELALRNVQMKLCPFDFKDPQGFENSSYLHALPDRKFDILVIDGSEEWTQVRPACFEYAERFIAPGGLIVVDDSWRYPGLRLRNRAKRHQVFKSVGPCRPGVTSTDVFFY